MSSLRLLRWRTQITWLAMECCLQSPHSSIMPPGKHCCGQVTYSPFSYGWKTRRKHCMGDFLPPCPHQPSWCSNEVPPLCGNVSGLPSLNDTVALDHQRLSIPRADILWLLSIGGRGGELIEWVSNLVARVTLSWLEGRDHRVQHRLCWIGKWCLIFTSCFCFWAGKGESKKG